ncbi:MAG: WD40 repeat domain-containing protein [archaeon]|nr:WD40 repeat domain-containing protein [archaeon]
MKKVPDVIFPFIFQNFDFLTTLKTIKYSQKVQKVLGFDLETYEMVNQLNLFFEEKKYLFPILDLAEVMNKFSKITTAKLKNTVYNYVMSKEKYKNYYLSHKIVFSQDDGISCAIKYPNKEIFICGTKKGEIFLIDLQNKTKLNHKICSALEHKGGITKIVQLKKIDKLSLMAGYIRIASSSKDKTMRIWDVSETEIKHLFVYNFRAPIFSLCEINESEIAVGSQGVLIVNFLNFEKSYQIDSHYTTTRSLLYSQNENKLLVGSTSLKKMDLKPMQVYGIFQSRQMKEIYTDKTFGINDIIILENNQIIICEDDHLKTVSFSKGYTSTLIYGMKNVYLNKVISVDDQPGILFACNSENIIYCYDIRNGSLIFEILTPHVGKITDIFYTEEGGILSFGADGNIIYIKDINQIIQKKKIFSVYSEKFPFGPFRDETENACVVIFKNDFDNMGRIEFLEEDVNKAE